MKILTRILFVSILLLGFSCTPKPEPPEVVAVKLFNALTSGNIDYVKKHLWFSRQDESRAMNDFLDIVVASDDYKNRTDGYLANYEAVMVNYVGDEAWVELKGENALGDNIRTLVHLLLVDGRWMVDGEHGVFHPHDADL